MAWIVYASIIFDYFWNILFFYSTHERNNTRNWFLTLKIYNYKWSTAQHKRCLGHKWNLSTCGQKSIAQRWRCRQCEDLQEQKTIERRRSEKKQSSVSDSTRYIEHLMHGRQKKKIPFMAMKRLYKYFFFSSLFLIYSRCCSPDTQTRSGFARETKKIYKIMASCKWNIYFIPHRIWWMYTSQIKYGHIDYGEKEYKKIRSRVFKPQQKTNSTDKAILVILRSICMNIFFLLSIHVLCTYSSLVDHSRSNQLNGHNWCVSFFIIITRYICTACWNSINS